MLKIKYQAHVAGEGWQNEVCNGQIAGTVGQNKAIEAVRVTGIEVPDGVNLGVAGHALVQDMGWGEDAVINQDIGSTGQNKHLEAIKLGLYGDNATDYDIWYRLHVQNKGFLDWCRNSEPNGTEGENLQAEAIQIFLVSKAENFWPASNTTIPFEKMENEINPPEPVQESESAIRKRIIDTAASHIGEGGSEFQARMGIPNQDWCAAYVSCIFIDCGLRDKIPISVSCPAMVNAAKANGTWRDKSYTPQSADVVFYDFNGNGVADHVGIVHSVPNASSIFAVEGNTGSPRLVRMQGRSINNILGYIKVL